MREGKYGNRYVALTVMICPLQTLENDLFSLDLLCQTQKKKIYEREVELL